MVTRGMGMAMVLGAAGFLAAGTQGNPQPLAQVPQAEKEEIQRGRRDGGARPVVPRGPVPEAERSRARIFKAVRNSVVHISAVTFRRVPHSYDLTKVPAGSGTGFVWDDAGHIVTNLHVVTLTDAQGLPVREAPALEVTLAGGKSYKADVIGRSYTHDIAVLRVFAPLEQLKAIPLGSTKDLEEGYSVLAIGHPFGLDHTLTTGVVSAKGRDIPTSTSLIRGAIQTDAAINPGNSGGPLLDSAGRLVGMNTAITTTSGSSAGIGFAIPVETLRRVVPELIRKGRLDLPFLGFDTLPAYLAEPLGILEGAVVDSVDADSPAGRAGLRGLSLAPGVIEPRKAQDVIVGDVIVGVNGKALKGAAELFDLIELSPANRDLELEVLRGGTRQKVVLKMEGRARAPKI